jgi:hypothetical protein
VAGNADTAEKNDERAIEAPGTLGSLLKRRQKGLKEKNTIDHSRCQRQRYTELHIKTSITLGGF